MKVVHIIKKIEMIDNDVRELKKLEKSVQRNKSFSTPIYMSIEKQINILLGERIKLLELQIANPPSTMVDEIEGPADLTRPAPTVGARPPADAKDKKPAPKKPAGTRKIDDLPLMTQDQIDTRFAQISADTEKKKTAVPAPKPEADKKAHLGDSVKILDIALEKGTLKQAENQEDRDKDKDTRVRFFRDNFPVD